MNENDEILINANDLEDQSVNKKSYAPLSVSDTLLFPDTQLIDGGEEMT